MTPILSTSLPAARRPWANWLLIAATLGVFVLQNTPVGRDWQTRYMLDSRTLRLRHFLTYAFLHLGPLHFLFNMVVLYVLGRGVNESLGHVGYGALYLAGGVAAGIGFVLAGGEPGVVGASGAVGGIMGAYLVFFPRSSILINLRRYLLEIPVLYFITVFFLYNVVMSLLARLGVHQIAYSAHVAGMAFGFIVGLVLLMTKLVPRLPNDLIELVATRPFLRRGFDPVIPVSDSSNGGSRPKATTRSS